MVRVCVRAENFTIHELNAKLTAFIIPNFYYY